MLSIMDNITVHVDTTMTTMGPRRPGARAKRLSSSSWAHAASQAPGRDGLAASGQPESRR
jgi:hypothetical protein